MQIPDYLKARKPVVGTTGDPIEVQFLSAIRDSGLCTPETIVADGEIHRFYASGRKKSKLNGWYVLSGPKHCGAFGDWATETKVFFTEHFSRPLTEAEKTRMESDRLALEELEKAARERRQKEVAEESAAIWKDLPPADPHHPYLTAKGITVLCGFRQADQDLVVPAYDNDGNITSLQYISPKVNKHFKTAGRIKGCYWWIGNDTPAFMAEGAATAAAIYQSTGKTCLVAFNADNLIQVAKLYPSVTIVADNDDNGKGETCARKSGSPFIIVPRLNEGDTDADDFMLSGGDLCELLKVQREKRVYRPLSDVILSPGPSRWLVRNMVPKGASLGMLFGKSGSTKSYLAISLMLSVATSRAEWFGHKVNSGTVLYLCGEGQRAAYERMACWLQQNRVTDIPDTMYVSEQSFNLDTPTGESEFLSSLEKELSGFSPDLVVIDTLNRYMASDENSTQESTLFIKALTRLSVSFNCSILLIHHTGVTEQDRARGSSVFLGAMDYQFKVSKTDAGNYCLEHTKNKAGIEEKPILYKLEPYEVEGWLDEDGHNVMNAIPVQIEEELTAEPERKGKHEDENALISAIARFGKYSDDDGFSISRPYFTEYFKSISDNPTSTSHLNRTNPNPSSVNRNKSVAFRLMTDGSIEFDETDNTFYVTGSELKEKIRNSRACVHHFQALDIDIHPIHPSSPEAQVNG